jgi:hypothetical protein
MANRDISFAGQAGFAGLGELVQAVVGQGGGAVGAAAATTTSSGAINPAGCRFTLTLSLLHLNLTQIVP